MSIAGCSRCGADPPPGARFCPSCGQALTSSSALHEERKLVTILFVDMIGSTGLGERLGPERLRVILGEYFEAMSAVIEAMGGTIEKFIGDAVMAAFGVPAIKEDDARRALAAALAMLERLEAINAGFRQRHGVELALRIGVNTGEVIAPLGDRAGQMIVAGDAVNVAARLQAAASPGTVLVGERTVAASGEAFVFGDPVALDLKGKSNPVMARRLLRAAPLPMPDRGRPKVPMIGRRQELAILEALLDDAIQRRAPHLALILGPAGIGKSRLAREFISLCARRESPPRVLTGRCLSVGTGITYWALSEILREACGIALDDPAEAVRRKLTEGVRTVLSTGGQAEVEETVEALATSAGIELPESMLASLEPKAVGEAMTRAWPRFLGALAANRTTVLVVEDLHWAEDRLVEMLMRILQRTKGPLFVVSTSRPDEANRLAAFAAGEGSVSAVALTALSIDESIALVNELLEAPELPDSFRRAIVEKADGNPFFLEELVHRLVDQGTLLREADRWRTMGSPEVVLPDSIQSLLSARIDGLPTDEKLILQEASVVGRDFWAAPLRRRLPEIDVSEALLGLERRGLILAKTTSSIAGEDEYSFRHALVRDVAYATLSRARRARAHAEMARWTEELVGERGDEFVELVAYHYRTAVVGEEADLAWHREPDEAQRIRSKAFTSLMTAGSVARRRYALGKAVELHEKATDLATTDEQRLESLAAIGDDHAAAYHGDEAVSAYLRALDISRRSAPAGRSLLLLKLAREAVMKSGTFHHHVGPSVVDEWIAEGLEAGPDDWTKGWLLALRSDLAQLSISLTGTDPSPIGMRIEVAEEALGIAREIGRLGLQAYASEVLMHAFHLAGDFAAALELAEERLALLAHTRSPSTTSAVLIQSAAMIGGAGGDWERTVLLGKEALEIARNLSPHELMHATGTTLEALYFLGRFDEALALLDEHLAAFADEANVSCASVRIGPVIGALIAAHQRRPEDARRLLDTIPVVNRTSGIVDGLRALVMVELDEAATGRSEAERLLGRPMLVEPGAVHMARLEALGRLEAWNELEPVLEQARPHVGGFSPLGVTIARLEGLSLLAHGNRVDATALIERAVTIADRMSMRVLGARAREALARVDPLRADHLMANAEATYRSVGALPIARERSLTE